MKLIFATDQRGRKRLLLHCTQQQAARIETYMGELPPWLIIDQIPVDGKVVLDGIEFQESRRRAENARAEGRTTSLEDALSTLDDDDDDQKAD